MSVRLLNPPIGIFWLDGCEMITEGLILFKVIMRRFPFFPIQMDLS